MLLRLHRIWLLASDEPLVQRAEEPAIHVADSLQIRLPVGSIDGIDSIVSECRNSVVVVQLRVGVSENETRGQMDGSL